ncbi:hypothetical protein ACEXQB_000370 [Herbiconiux sp. P18]|uniref:hypothetical protein n=1 Tax=Herbiconiux liangxiaofengii TaxID=3342795 RepID=UPI0035BA4D0A
MTTASRYRTPHVRSRPTPPLWVACVAPGIVLAIGVAINTLIAADDTALLTWAPAALFPVGHMLALVVWAIASTIAIAALLRPTSHRPWVPAVALGLNTFVAGAWFLPLSVQVLA